MIFEGRDAAGKGGTIKRITEYMNPRVARHVALPKPTERERAQWYFQRYVANLPPRARSRCSTAPGTTAPASSTCSGSARSRSTTVPAPVPDLRAAARRGRPPVDQVLVLGERRRTGAPVPEADRRPDAAWKLSPTDLYSRTQWVDFSRAKDEMFVHTDIPESPWYVVEADDKKRARLNASPTCSASSLGRQPLPESRSRPASGTRAMCAPRPTSTPTCPTTRPRSSRAPTAPERCLRTVPSSTNLPHLCVDRHERRLPS